jgi:drug/metabolite transporter (DMT)-like permease
MTATQATAWRIYFIWFVLIACETGAQLALKLAAGQSALDLDYLQWLTLLATNKWFMISIAFDIASFFAWMSILRRHNLSVAVPLTSLCYIAIVMMTVVFLHEPVTSLQLIGLSTIGLGIFFLTKQDFGESARHPTFETADRG